ncbi:acyltransferase [Candidatus Beckwithbacteria bacterium]|nr:acyltransferase [Candidatus Beckwithbacteria bacterium]
MFKDRMGRPLSNQEAGHKIINRFYNWILDFELMILRFVSCVPLFWFRKFFYVLAGIKIGKGSVIHIKANFFKPANITIGEDTIIGMRAFLDGRDKLQIGNHVDIASEVMIYNSQHDIDSFDFKPIEKSVIIHDYVFIGPRAIILPGVTIGKGAIVAAGAVVAEDVPEMTVVGGVPAKKIRMRKEQKLAYTLGRARLFQ